VERIPVTAKIRAGGEDDALLEDVARAVEAGGASLLTVHCRTRREAYRDTADWERLRRAVRVVSIPVCGNGGVESHADLARLRAETGCTFVMVGRAALADPWIFGGHRASPEEAADFLRAYAEALGEQAGMAPAGVAGRLKQLMRTWGAGGLFAHDRERWLQSPPEALLAELRELHHAAADPHLQQA
jgi:tRNA-dihydrouridine synthase C